MSVADAKARLLTLDEPTAGGSSPFSSFVLPAAGAALLLGMLVSRRRPRGRGLMGLDALAANPTLRTTLVTLAGAVLRRFLAPPAR